jgi:PAS domain S-box-containing protein
MKTKTRTAIFALSRSMAQALLLLLVVAVPVVASDAVPVAEKHKSVLLLFSEDSSLPTQAIIEQSLRSTLRNDSPVPLEVSSEYLGFRRTPVDAYEKELVSLLRRKYEGRKFDLIITVQPTALGVLLKNRPEIFPDTPVVFQVLDQRDVAGLNLGPNVTGVWGEINFKPNLDLALMLHPNTSKVVLLGGVSEFDKYWMARVQQDFLAYEGKLEFTYLIGLTIAEQQQALSSLPPHTIVVFVSTTRDNAGNNHYNPDFLRQISAASSAPIYGTTDGQLGSGIVGGSIVSFEAFGVQTAKLGLRILAGEKPQAIAPHGVPNVVMFDWRELRRWGIDESRLPAGSIVRYKEFSVWELYKWRIIGAVALIILQALLIIGLLLNRSRRRQAEKDNERLARLAEAERRRLDEVVSNVPGIVWEARAEPGTDMRKAVFVSDYVEKMLGYSVEEWKSTPGFALMIIPEEDREQSTREAQALLESGKEGVLQTRWVKKDGHLIWVESQMAPIIDEAGKPVGLRGVTMDITDRRLAEESVRESEERLKQAISVARFGIFEHDHLTGILNVSPLTREIHAWGERDTPTLEGLLAQVHPEDREMFIAAVGRAHDPAGDGFFAREYRIVVAGGNVRWVSARSRTLFEGGNGDRRPVRTIGAELDITEHKEAEVALRAYAEEVNRLKNQFQEENIYLQEEIKLAHNVDEIIGRSNAIKYVLFKIEQVSQTDATVMILGETGTGKELVARAIHSQSLRKDRPLVKVNCAALSAGLIESELFGHEKGSFTGAVARKIGRFELADGATLFLDEIGELPLDLQSKLLRVIQEGEFERLGSSKTIKVDVRIIAATNRNMKAEVEKGAFREDLWYRLNVFPITVPPLRQRKEDIPPMVEHFVSSLSRKVGKDITAVSSATLKKLQDYSWPGNVRELVNVIERGVINARGPVLHLAADQFEQPKSHELAGPSRTLDEIEKEYITRILADTAWKIEGPNGAARILGLNPSTLRTRMVKLGIQKGVQRSAQG